MEILGAFWLADEVFPVRAIYKAMIDNLYEALRQLYADPIYSLVTFLESMRWMVEQSADELRRQSIL